MSVDSHVSHLQDARFYSHVLLLVPVEPHRLPKQTVSSR